MIDWLLEPYQYEFMRRALLVLIVTSVVMGVVGAFVVHKGLAFSGDALAHSTLAGVAVAFVAGGSVGFGALVAAVLTSLGIGWTRERARVSADTAIGIVFVAMFSLGLLILSRRTSYTPDLMSFVFGNILGVSSSDVVGSALLAGAVLLFVGAFYRELLLVAYDPAMAATAGVPARLFQYATLVMVALAVVVALKAIGIVLVNAMLLIPVSTASLFFRRLPSIMAAGTLVGLACATVGLHLSYYVGVATSPAIVLTASVVFLGSLAVTSRRGLQPSVPAAEPAAS
ncbi:MAG: metal ABC transporter permease [Dehalococcoidia bacterium]|nr:MAG: metal ABC transporter permease [Dehalococcoidia bacterium]